MLKPLLGSYAVAHAVRAASAEVVAAYPITPQTSIVEKLAEFCATDQLKAQYIAVESEHSAMAACIGAATAGARAFTATSSQGLALMHELLHWAAGSRLPIVLANANRALAAPWSIGADHSDSLSQRDTGWLQFYVESPQEAFDTIVQSFRLAELVSLPVMVNLDGFILTHITEAVDIPDNEAVASYLPPFEPEFRLDVEDPRAFNGGMVGATGDLFINHRYQMKQAMDLSIEKAGQVDREFNQAFGRSYGLVEGHRLEGAELILVSMGTMAGTVRAAVDQLRGEGLPVGALRLRLFRPFPSEEILAVLGRASRVAVLDRDYSPGGGGVLAQEIKAALQGRKGMPEVFGFVAGIGGQDVTTETVRTAVERTYKGDFTDEERLWLGLLD